MENREILRGAMKKIIVIFLFIIFSSTTASAAIFKGRVIDAETKEPIEGAVVVAHWVEARGDIAGPSTELKDVKETLTDKNGEWIIEGPAGGRDTNFKLLFTFITRTYYTREPNFIVFKPGYWSYPAMFGNCDCFIAYPYIGKQRIMKRTAEGKLITIEEDLEGIVLVRPGEIEKYLKEQDRPTYDPSSSVPFIPMKSPERQLRDLNFSFEYSQSAKWIVRGKECGPFKRYTVVGLRKAETREDRLRALPDRPGGEGTDEKMKNLIKLINQERRKLGLGEIDF